MNSLTNRIKSSNVQIGSNFVLPLENCLKDEETRLKKMVLLANSEKERLIQEGTNQAKALVEEAKQILAQAQIDAEDIIKTANETATAQADDIKEQARKEGYDDGQKQGYKDGTNALEEKVKAVDIFAKSQFDLKQNIIKSAELDIVKLVIQIAKKVCKKTLDNDLNVLKEITVDAINKLKDRESITITINPELAEKIYSISEELKNDIPKLNSIKIIEDSNVSADGTIVETPLSRVDCRISTQIEQIADKLMSAHFQSDEVEKSDAIENFSANSDEVENNEGLV